eukprot:6211343-Pleurochrysis_carterae.AAC.6
MNSFDTSIDTRAGAAGQPKTANSGLSTYFKIRPLYFDSSSSSPGLTQLQLQRPPQICNASNACNGPALSCYRYPLDEMTATHWLVAEPAVPRDCLAQLLVPPND